MSRGRLSRPLEQGRELSAARRLIAVNRFYWPDHSATSQILTDLCQRAAAEGLCVTVITSRMRYDAPKERLDAREVSAGVQIRRVWTTRFGRDRAALRGIDYASFYVSAFVALLTLARRDDVILAKTDPPLISVPAALAARLTGARLVAWMQDVFPEVAGALGMRWAERRPGRVLRRLRDRSLARARTVVAISDGMAGRMRQALGPAAPVRVIPNWSCERIRPVARPRNRLRRDWGLEDRFVIGYSGNLGRAHAAGAIAELVRQSAGIPRLGWLFIGGGAGLAEVRAAAAEAGVDARFQPYQPRERLSESLSAADLHLVSLDPACEGLIMPSKLVGVMAAGRGVLALAAPEGDLARAVRTGGFGAVLDIRHPAGWRATLEMLATHAAADALGTRARACFEREGQAEARLVAWLDVLAGRAAPATPRPEPDLALAAARAR